MSAWGSTEVLHIPDDQIVEAQQNGQGDVDKLDEIGEYSERSYHRIESTTKMSGPMVLTAMSHQSWS